MNSIFISNHNFTNLGVDQIDLEYWNGSAWTFLAVISPADDPIFKDGLNQTRTDFRLKFNKASGSLSNPPQCGLIYIGEEAVLPLYLNEPKRGLNIDIVTDMSLSGLPFASASTLPRQTWKLDFGAMKAADNYQSWRWLNTVGIGLHPFWIKDMDGHWHFVRIRGNSFATSANGNVVFDLKNIQLEEERVGAKIELSAGYSVL